MIFRPQLSIHSIGRSFFSVYDLPTGGCDCSEHAIDNFKSKCVYYINGGKWLGRSVNNHLVPKHLYTKSTLIYKCSGIAGVNLLENGVLATTMISY